MNRIRLLYAKIIPCATVTSFHEAANKRTFRNAKRLPASNDTGSLFAFAKLAVEGFDIFRRMDDQAFFFSFCSMSTTSLPP
jgi:CCR4-NOT transcriptional regulation complex NOT5 subunit